jgi:hypothetical protein
MGHELKGVRMKKFLAGLLVVASLAVAGFAATAARAYNNPQWYCQTWQAGQLSKNSAGQWYVCGYYPPSPTGFAWLRLV